MQELKDISTYIDYKNALKRELTSAAVSFVRIGYLLKQARDTDILKDSTYSNMEEFAKTEFQLDKSQVSRFININDRFSVGGNSEILEEKYQDYGVAKLGIMLTLSDEVVDNLSPKLSKQQIGQIQKDIKAEQEIGGTELILEGTDPEQDKYKEIIGKCIFEYYHTHPHEYVKICNIEEWNKEDVMQIFCPMGVMAETVRLQGIGRYMISVKDFEHNVTFTNVRENATEECSWEYLIDTIFNVCMCHEGVVGHNWDAEEAWEIIYNEEFPKPPKPEPKPEPKKEISKPAQKDKPKEKVKKSESKPEEKPVAPVQPKTVPAQAPVPAEIVKTEEKEKQNVAVPQSGQTVEETPREISLESASMLEQKKRITGLLDKTKTEMENSYFEMALEVAKETVFQIEQLIKLKQMEDED